MSEQSLSNSSPQHLEGMLLDGRYFIQRRLGAGGFGAVYLAEQRVFHVKLRQVALKLFHSEIVTPENVTRVFNDALMLIQLQNEPEHSSMRHHLITVYDAGFLRERPGQAFVAMEYVDGYHTPRGGIVRTLQGLMELFQPTPVDLALTWTAQILTPLAWMHTLPHPVVHCDLKPDNVLVAGKNTLKLADFGLAQLAYQVAGGGGGAITYQSPETLMGLSATSASDVYTVGLMLYQMLFGRNPLSAVGMEARVAGQHDRYREMQVQARADGLPDLAEAEHGELAQHPLLIAIIDRCLRFRASERYTTAAALLRDIEAYRTGQAPTLDQRSPFEGANKEDTFQTPLAIDRLLGEAQAYLQQQNFDMARSRCEEARAQFPHSSKPYRWLAEIHLAKGQWQTALKVCAAGRAISPNDPDLYDVGARAYERGGQSAVAAQMRRQCRSLRQKANT